MKINQTCKQLSAWCILCICAVGFSFAASAQGIIVKGTVEDGMGPVIGASIMEVGTTNGTSTDIDGNFSLSVKTKDATLRVSYIGCETQTLKVTPGQAMAIKMVENSKALDEVVVVGFGTQKRENLTGSVSQVKMDEVLGDRPVTSVQNALQGAIPGLYISGGSQPGTSKSISLRGQSSINNAAPLVLIDNVEGDMDMLNPEDIESVTVLKDAASSAIYGARAASGVILITTKRAKNGDKIKINYNNNFGFQTSINQPKQASLDSYLQAYQDAEFDDNYFANSISVSKWREYLAGYKANPSAYPTVGDGIYVGEDGNPYFLNEKNIYKGFLETSFMHQHNMTVTGGSDRVRFRLAGGLSQEDGPLVTNKDNFARKNISAYLGVDITKWYTQEVDLRLTNSTRSTPQSVGDGIYNANHISYYPEGIIPASITGTVDLPSATGANIIENQNASHQKRENFRFFSKSTFKPIKNLDIVAEYTYDKKNNDQNYYANQWNYTTIQFGTPQTSVNEDYYYLYGQKTIYNAFNLYGTYNYNLNEDNHFKLMAGFNQERKEIETQYVYSYNQTVPTAPTLQGGTLRNGYNNYSDYAIRGAFYRLNYNYQDKYLLEANGRYDGSSKFPKGHRYGFFPSFSAGWNISKEKFMESTRQWMNELKLRGSWGLIGNQNIDNYQSVAQMTVTDANSYWIQDDKKVTYITVPNLVSNSFTWEKVGTLDFGLDVALLSNRLRGTFDWYSRTTSDMLVAGVQLPSIVGAEAPLQNTACMNTKGWELGISWRDRKGDWSYSVGFNLSDYKSKITKFNNAEGTLSFNGDGTLASGVYYEGQTLGEIWGFKSDGYYTASDFVDAVKWALKDGVTSINGTIVHPGDEKFKNLSDASGKENTITYGTSLADPGDRTVIGNTTPRYMYGINLGAGWKGFDLSIMLQGVGKRDLWIGGASLFPFGGESAAYRAVYYNQTDYWTPVGDCGGQYTTTDLEYWEAANPNAKTFRIYNKLQNAGSNTRVSDKYLQNGAYLRVKNVTLSYTFKNEWIRKAYLNNLKLFVSAENLATFTSLPKGYDPERPNWGYPFYRTISFGVNVTL